MTLYVNEGSPVTATFSTPWASTGLFDIGHSGAAGWFPGSISDVRAWDYALTPTQVKALYQQIS